MRVAFSSIVRNNASKSPGDELITRSTSDVAVCCSSASRNSLSSRVLDGDNRLIRESGNEINLLLGEGLNLQLV
jgi:hypothetical protein